MLHRHVLALLTFLAFAFAVAPSTQADTIQLLTRSQLTPGFVTTDYPNIVGPAVFLTPLTVVTGGVNVTFDVNFRTTTPPAGGRILRVNSDGFLFDFPAGTELLVTDSGGGVPVGPLTIIFSVPILEFGLDAQNAFFEAGATSTFTFSLFDGPTLLDTYTRSGPDTSGLFFLGARAILGQRITRIVISGASTVNSVTSPGNPDTIAQNNFAIGPVSFTPIPEPTTVVLLGTGLVGAAVARRRKRRNTNAQ